MSKTLVLICLYSLLGCSSLLSNKKQSRSYLKKHHKEKEENYCICMEIYAPVCGRNHKTYANECLAKCEKISFTEGECLVD